MLLQEIINWVFSQLVIFLFCLCSIFYLPHSVSNPCVLISFCFELRKVPRWVLAEMLDRGLWVNGPPASNGEEQKDICITTLLDPKTATKQCTMSNNHEEIVGMILQASVILACGSAIKGFFVCLFVLFCTKCSSSVDSKHVLWQAFKECSQKLAIYLWYYKGMTLINF